ncbi:MAG: HAMP domain-containing sensor histidine kinase, partial [Clostridia bacterium]
MGVSYYAVATSLIGLVGDYLFDDRMQQDRARADQLAVEVAPLFSTAQMSELQRTLMAVGGELGGRLMVLDANGKVQADSFSELNGSRMELPEVASILAMGKTADYGVHRLSDSSAAYSVLRFLRPYDQNANWVAYCTSALTSAGKTVGVLLYSSPIQTMMQRLFALQDQMVMYFFIAATVALVIAMFFSRVITKPIASLTRSIQRMGRGDFSVRVPVKGSGELRRLSETFNTMSEKLEMLDKSRNQFVSNASHELKTPLSTMKILLENIIYQPEMDVEVRTEFLTDINKEIDRLNLIINDLLTLVSMDSKTMRLNRTTFS